MAGLGCSVSEERTGEAGPGLASEGGDGAEEGRRAPGRRAKDLMPQDDDGGGSNEGQAERPLDEGPRRRRARGSGTGSSWGAEGWEEPKLEQRR